MELAVIKRIEHIIPIDGCDNIALAMIDGWQVIIKKSDFKLGDLCVYVKRDSVLPRKPEFEFMERYKYRVYTIKMKGVISQGICFPLSILPTSMCYISVGNDVTDILGITKYETPVNSSDNQIHSGKPKGNFPSYLHKTEEYHIQDIIHKLRESSGHTFMYITEKLDGTSISLIKLNGAMIVCSRNLIVDETSDYYKTLKSTGIYDKLKDSMFNNIALQGEMIGVGIQGNKYKLDHKDIYIFNAYDINNSQYLSYPTMEILLELLNIKSVPVISKCEILSDDISYYNDLSIRQSLLNSNVKAEGIVVRAHDFNNGISFKVLNTEFLIEHKL